MACNSSTAIRCTEVSIGEMAKEEYGLEEWPEGLPDKSLSCPIREYVVVTPLGGSDADYVMLFQNREALFVRQGGISSIFEKGRIALDATDSDNDGTFDRMSYSVSRDDRWDDISVTDKNFDGQPDMRSYHKKGGALEYWMWVENGWYKTPRLGSGQVLVDGAPKAYDVDDGRFVFALDESEGRMTAP
jgi:hypothetical protein